MTTMGNNNGNNNDDNGDNSRTGGRWNCRGLTLLFIGGVLLASIRREFAFFKIYRGEHLQSSSNNRGSSTTRQILSQAQRRARTKFIKTVRSEEQPPPLDLQTVQVVKDEIDNLLGQVGQGDNSMMLMGDLKATIHQALENVQSQATGTSTSITSTSSTSKSKRPDGLKIAFYMTTHVSDLHLEYLQKCWPAAMAKLDILQHVDLIVYTSNYNHDNTFQSLGFDNVIFKRYNETVDPNIPDPDKLPNDKNMQKQEGALRGMVDPFLVHPGSTDWKTTPAHWFADYDWVIRLNPDVLIRNDTWLLSQMRSPSVQGIFVRWDTPSAQLYLHTDFSAFRPSAIDYDAMLLEYQTQRHQGKFRAERHFTFGFQHLLKQQPDTPAVAFVPRVVKSTTHGVGHVGGYHCDIVHIHPFVKHCPDYFQKHDRVNRFY
ncbi:expressed unknown protein [Seminavis robusta]|uniref:Uncharacterized protein n=1 Tax=Seminavis robusta TaxID=568900 RepID=A0A9N8HVI7_9STRA|nr:expressed unknown protein [Seminavis robusta]|eukprot:Sro1991_g309790.1 n/a (429) ;mRNA; r:9178-10464